MSEHRIPGSMVEGGSCPDDAVFLRARNADDQLVFARGLKGRPTYVFDDKSERWVRVQVTRPEVVG